MPRLARFLSLRATTITASSSAEDSMFRNPTPARIASSSSGAVFPTPENTIELASNPAASARRSSPTETMSAPAPSALRTFLIRAQYHALQDALKDVPHPICYSVKANGNIGGLKGLQAPGAGAHTPSVGAPPR